METYYTVNYHYENVPHWARGLVEAVFMRYRSEAVDAVNGLYEGINLEWDKTGKPASLGPYLEDINPEYAKFINERIQPIIDEKVNKNRIFRIVSGPYCDLEMTIKGIDGSRVWIDLNPVS